jgi:hypothetical protein
MQGRTRYLNTDLDVVSGDDLTPLAAAFEKKKWSVLHCEQHADRLWRAGFEVPGGQSKLEKAIPAMLKVIETLTPPLQSLWAGCSKRDFNIGFDGGYEPRSAEYTLASGLLARIAAVGASVTITIYAVVEEEPSRLSAG